jgi:hypothetical protein
MHTQHYSEGWTQNFLQRVEKSGWFSSRSIAEGGLVFLFDVQRSTLVEAGVAPSVFPPIEAFPHPQERFSHTF